MRRDAMPDFVSPEPAAGRGVALDLFAGAGGLSVGLEQAGMDIAGAVDVEAGSVAVHAANFPYGASVHGDLSAMSGDEIRARCGLTRRDVDVLGMGQTPTAPGTLTLLSGGPPCQGFSQMGKQDVSDPRSALLSRFAELTLQLAPRYALCENVPGLIRNPAFRPHLDAFLETLTRGGYNVVEPRILNASSYGVPQSRERVVFLIYRRGEVAPAYPEATHGVDDLLLQPTPRVSDALNDLPEASDYPELWDSDRVALPPDAWGAPSPYAMRMRGLSNDPDDLSYQRQWNPYLLTASQLTKHDPKRVEIYRNAPVGRMIPGDKLVKLDPHGLAPTLRAGSGSYTAARPVHPYMGRVVTNREAARLHGINDAFIPHPTKLWGIRNIGNSVPPPLARAVGHAIRKAAGIEPRRPSVVIEGAATLIEATLRAA